MRLALFAAALAAASAMPLAAQDTAPDRPALVVAIAVDQLSSDLFQQYRAHFTGGLARLADGAVFPTGYQAHAATETCPGHATILTGAHPARSGVIGNRWFDMRVAREDVRVYCAEDAAAEASSSEDYTVSPNNLLVPTLGDLLKRADPQSRTVSIGGKDRSAVMLAGREADHVYWPAAGGLQSFGGPEADKPAAIRTANARIAGIVGRPRAARPLPAQCAALSRAVPIGGGQSVGTGLFASDAVDGRDLLTSPDADEILLEAAAGMVGELELGQRGSTDLLAIGLAATDYIGHTYGTAGAEMCIQVAALDAALGRFFDALDAQGVAYVAMLTSDHGGLDLPERQRAQGIADAQRLDPEGFRTLDATLAQELGLPTPVIRSDGPFGDFYVDRSVPDNRRVEAIDRAVALLRAMPQVYAVFTRDQLMAQPVVDAPPEHWTVLDRARAAFHPDRSGDFVVLLEPRVTPIPDPTGGYVATHGSPWNYDREVPILFWWPGAEHMEQPLGVMTVDILPTLASLIGLDISQIETDGRCLDVTAAIAQSNCP